MEERREPVAREPAGPRKRGDRCYLREWRELKRLTQDELGHRVGLSKATISKYENDLGDPPLSALRNIARAFGLRTIMLFWSPKQIFRGHSAEAPE